LYLHEIEEGQRVFIDANIFVYHFSQGSRFNKSCTEFLCRVEKAEIHGITSTAIILEATHRLMMGEASSVVDIEVKNLPKYLKQHPELVKQLTKHLAIPGKISKLNVEIIPITAGLIEESQVLKPKYGFLSNDTLTLKVMDEYKVTSLASNDMDFKRVDWVKLYLPSSANDIS